MTQEKKAIVFANIAAIILIIIKTVAWIMTWSMAVLSSAVDSLLDFIVSSVNLYILKRSSSPNDENYNYWHGKIEWFGAIFEWFVVMASWLVVIYLAVQKILHNEWISQIDISIIIMLISILITWALVYYLHITAKKTKSLVVKADLLHYKSDLFTNLWIIFSLGVIYFTWWQIIDSVVSIVIASYILFSSFEIIKEWFYMLMDKSFEDKDVLKQIEEIIMNTSPEVTWFHHLKTRKSWKDVFIEFHLVMTPDIKLVDAHQISDLIEIKIRRLAINNSRILIHLDPYDDSQSELNKNFEI